MCGVFIYVLTKLWGHCDVIGAALSCGVVQRIIWRQNNSVRSTILSSTWSCRETETKRFLCLKIIFRKSIFHILDAVYMFCTVTHPLFKIHRGLCTSLQTNFLKDMHPIIKELHQSGKALYLFTKVHLP